MPDKAHRVALIIATKDRFPELVSLLKSLVVQSDQPEQIIIVDSSKGPREIELKQAFPQLPITYCYSLPPCAARQRNKGLQYVWPQITLVAFCDDDVVFDPAAWSSMTRFWKAAAAAIGGAAFTMVNHPEVLMKRCKSLPWAERIGVYSKQPGRVMSSGFQTLIGCPDRVMEVQWLPSTAVVWRRDVLRDFIFDEWYSDYSYLEDLDFSYTAGKKYRLAVVADAGYYHYASPAGRVSSFMFGRKEILNRLYFVRKHTELRLSACYCALCFRMALSIILFFREQNAHYGVRVAGNCIGLWKSIFL